MNYKIKTINLKKENEWLDNALVGNKHRPLKWLSSFIYLNLFRCEKEGVEYTYKNWEHVCKVNAGIQHKKIMREIKEEFEELNKGAKFYIMNRIIKDHFEKERLMSTVADRTCEINRYLKLLYSNP